jgi:hypothetical protein
VRGPTGPWNGYVTGFCINDPGSYSHWLRINPKAFGTDENGLGRGKNGLGTDENGLGIDKNGLGIDENGLGKCKKDRFYAELLNFYPRQKQNLASLMNFYTKTGKFMVRKIHFIIRIRKCRLKINPV